MYPSWIKLFTKIYLLKSIYVMWHHVMRSQLSWQNCEFLLLDNQLLSPAKYWLYLGILFAIPKYNESLFNYSLVIWATNFALFGWSKPQQWEYNGRNFTEFFKHIPNTFQKFHKWVKSYVDVNPFCANFTKWSNTLKKFVRKLLTNCLSVFDHFLGLALKVLM